LSILKDSADLTCESSIITYWKTFSQRIYWINISDLSGQYLKEIFIKNYQQIINLEIIKEPIRIGFYHNDLKQTTKKEMLFYIKKVAQDIKGIFNKFNLSNFETVNDNKFIFTIRSD
jgi:pyrimidine operon attenuation protein/uracil phosphoribosyltransferase